MAKKLDDSGKGSSRDIIISLKIRLLFGRFQHFFVSTFAIIVRKVHNNKGSTL